MERRLGRGLGSLLGGTPKEEEVERVEVEAVAVQPEGPPREVPVERIHPNPHQPRTHFDAEGLEELVASIKNHGILQPICVRQTGPDRFEIISGERRWRSAQEAGLESIPVVIREDVSDDQMLELALVENVQRRDLDAMEKARGYQDLMTRLGKTQQEVADQVGMKRATVANHLRLLDLPPPVQDGISKGLLSMGHARALLGLGEDTRAILRMFEKTVRECLSVRQVEQEVKVASKPKSADSNPEALKPQQPAWVKEIEDRIQGSTGARAQIKNAGSKYRGQIVLHYHDRAELDRLIERLSPTEYLE